MRTRIFVLCLASCAVAACSGEPREETREEVEASVAGESAPAPPPASAAAPESAAVPSVEEIVAAEDALDEENRREYERRERSMAGYDECMAQARGLPAEARARIEAACERRREAP